VSETLFHPLLFFVSDVETTPVYIGKIKVLALKKSRAERKPKKVGYKKISKYNGSLVIALP